MTKRELELKVLKLEKENSELKNKLAKATKKASGPYKQHHFDVDSGKGVD